MPACLGAWTERILLVDRSNMNRWRTGALATLLFYGLVVPMVCASEPMDVRVLIARIESNEALDADQGFSNFGLTVENSYIVVRTPVINKIVTFGIPAVPHLIREMKEEDCSFNRFTRCHSACNQILVSRDRRAYVFWTGGCGCDGRGIRRGVPVATIWMVVVSYNGPVRICPGGLDPL